MVADRDKHQPQSKSAYCAVCGTGLAWQMRQDNLASLYMCPQQSKNTSRGVCVQPVLAACKRLMVADRDKHQPQSKSACAVCGTGLAWQMRQDNLASLYMCPQQSKNTSRGVCVHPVLAACKRLMVADRDKHQPQSKSACAVCGTGFAWQMRQDNLASLYMCPQQSKNTSRGVRVHPVLAACKRLMVADRDKHQPQSKSACAVCGTGLAWQMRQDNLASLYMCRQQSKNTSRGVCVQPVLAACKRLMVADRDKHQPQSKSACAVCGTGLAWQMRQDNLASLYMCPQQSKNTSRGVCVQPVLAACKRLMVADRDKHQPQSKSACAVCGTGLAWQMRQDNLASLYMCPQQSKNTSRGVCVHPVLAACKRLMVADRDKHQPQSKSAFAVCGTGLAWQMRQDNLASLYMCLQQSKNIGFECLCATGGRAIATVSGKHLLRFVCLTYSTYRFSLETS